MSDPIIINEAQARRDGIDVERLKRWYASRRQITVETGDLARNRGEKECSLCGQARPLDDFEQIQRRDGSFGQRRGRCSQCVGRKARKTTAPVEHRQCDTCPEKRPPADFIDRWGVTRKSCAQCRGLCCKPPYGTTTCPGCDQEVHRQEFRMKAAGQVSQGRPFQTCLACRGA